jgi:hypothetical protein
MIAAAAAIEEALGLLTAGTAEATAGTRAVGAGLNDLDRASRSTSKALAVDFVRAVRETIQKLNALADEIIELKGGAEKYSKQNDTLIAGAIIYDQVLKENYKSALGMTGAAIIFGDTLMSYTKAALKQQDFLVKGYQRLSEFGAIDSTGLRGVLDTIKRVGASPETMEFMLNTIQKNSEDLAMFGGTVSQGAMRLTKVTESLIAPGDAAYQTLTNLGYTNEDILKYSASYASQTSRMMSTSTKDTAALRAETLSYLETLSELSELTGISRDKQKEAAEELQKTTEFRLYLRKLEQSGDPAQVAMAKELSASMALIYAQNKDQGLAIMDRLLNKGPTSEKSANMGLQVDNAARLIEDMARSGKKATDIASSGLKQLGADSGQVLNTLGDSLGLSKEFQQRMGVDYKTFNTEILGKNQDAARKFVEEQMKTRKEEGDDRLNSEARRKQAEMAYANYQQELYYNMGKVAVPAMEHFVQGLIATATALNGFTPDMLGNLRPESALKEFDKIKKAQAIQDATDEQMKIGKRIIENQQKTEKLSKVIESEKANGGTRSAGISRNMLEQQRKKLEEEKAQLERESALAKEKEQKLKATNTNISATTQNVNELLSGLRLKQGPEGALKPGGKVLPETALAAQEFAKLFPNYTQFNAFDDKHHTGSRTSLHPTGRAFDVGVTEKPSDAVLKDLKEKLKDFGVTNLRYESKNEPGSTGNHLHVEVDPTQLKSKKVSMTTPNYTNMDNTNVAKINTQPNSVVGQVGQDNTIVVSKLDELRTLFSRSLNVQESILAHTRMIA